MQKFNISKFKVVIVASEFYPQITASLLKGALDAYKSKDGRDNNLSIYKVPGAFELPGAVKQVLSYNSPDLVITLGAIIRGETPHFDFVSAECAKGIRELSMGHNKPIMFGVLTTDNIQQAIERSQKNKQNKGWEVMKAGIETLSTYKDIQSQSI